MKRSLRIKAKMLLYILSTSLFIYITAIGYISYNARKTAYNDATKKVDAIAEKNAFRTQANLNVEMDVARTLAHSFTNFLDIPNKQRNVLSKKVLTNVFIHNSDFLAIWLHWELNAIDSNHTNDFGRVRNTFYRENDKINFRTDSLDLDGDVEGGIYYQVKTSGKEIVTEPYFYSYTGKKKDEILETSVCVPVMKNEKFVGLMGIDLDLNRFQKVISKIKPFKNSYAFLLSHDGQYISNPDMTLIGKSIYDYLNSQEEKNHFKKILRSGKLYSYISENDNGEKTYISYAPFVIGKTVAPWYIGITVPLNIILDQANKSFLISIIVGIIGLILISSVIWYIAYKISNPLVKTTEILKKLALGEIDISNKIDFNRNDEIGEMAKSVNKLIDGLNQTTDFAKHIGDGNLSAEYKTLSEKDTLGNSLLEMRTNLMHARNEEEKHSKEEEIQNWVTQGLAKFGDILRNNNDDINLLSFNIMNNLVNYINANQGALFIRNDDDENHVFYELQSAIAYERHRLLEQKINIGDGLVGRCAHEKLTIYLKDIPKDYARITSGLGDAAPTNILLVPLNLNNQVYGIIEIASFNLIDENKIKFVEKLSENIASTISSVKINERTARLLEESQKQHEELSAQEEEMRQNLEEMHTTQEEAARKQTDINSLWEALNQSNLVVELDREGKILNANKKNSESVGIPVEEMIGKYHKDFAREAKENPELYNQFWSELLQGKIQYRLMHLEMFNKELWIAETYTPIINENGDVEKILNIGTDISETKNIEIQLRKELDNLKKENKF